LLEGLSEKPGAKVAKPTVDVIKQGVDPESLSVTGLEYLGSYSWLDSTKEPTIIVPASPPVWKEVRLPFQVPVDTGVQFIDLNAHQFGSRILLPLLQVVEHTRIVNDKPEFDWPSVDLVTDRNGLRKLLRWATATAADPPRDFRIDTQLAGEKTVLFNRWEERNSEDASERRSYAQGFSNRTTEPAPGCRGATGHHRIVSYNFGGLKIVLRYSVDACLPLEFGDGDELADLVSNLKLGSANKSDRASDFGELNIITAGSEIPQSSIIEIKTRSERSVANFDWAEAYPQLYLSQTPLLYLGIHNRGRFTAVSKDRVDNYIQVAREAQPGFRKLKQALEAIQTLVKEYGLGGRVSLVCKDGELRVYERRSSDSCLPDKFLALFERSG